MQIDVQGTCAPGFEPVRDAFVQGFEERGELAGAVAVHLDGELVVDLWAGPGWRRDTIVHAYSVAKPFAAVCALLLVDRGVLDLDAPVARYWPEYAQAGKERTLVRHVLAHQAGLLLLREPQPREAWFDWDRLASLLAAEPPLWEPGTRHGEHAAFYGHLAGELVRRVDGRSLGRFFADEVAAAWRLDFHFGLGAADVARTVDLVDPEGAWHRGVLADPRPLVVPALDNPPGLLDVEFVNSAEYRAAEVPAVNGHGSARAVARFYDGLAAGGVLDGVRLLRPDTVEKLVGPQTSGHDALLERDVAWGFGVQTEADGSFGMGGMGGFVGYGDRRAGSALGYGYVTSRLAGHDRSQACEDALAGVLAAHDPL